MSMDELHVKDESFDAQSPEASLLREIWQELDVGHEGFLNAKEINLVCQHIGMTEMTPHELDQLFLRLDADGDGRVSFSEFLRGLFDHSDALGDCEDADEWKKPTVAFKGSEVNHNGLDASPSSQFTSTKNSIKPKSKHVAKVTPPPPIRSLVSFLDEDGSGFVKCKALFEFMESLGISNDDFRLENLIRVDDDRVNLKDLSKVFDRAFTDVEDSSLMCRAALGALKYELAHIKSVYDDVILERNKLRADLIDSSHHVSKLLTEADERYCTMEKLKDAEILVLRRRCAEEIKKETDSAESDLVPVKQQSVLSEIDRLKEKEGKLLANIALNEQERKRLEVDLLEMSNNMKSLQATNARQRIQLTELDELKIQLQELVLSRDDAMEACRLIAQTVQELESKNQVLVDQADEYSQKIAELNRQLHLKDRQLASMSVHRTGSRTHSYSAMPDDSNQDGDSVQLLGMFVQLPDGQCSRQKNFESGDFSDHSLALEMKQAERLHMDEIEGLLREKEEISTHCANQLSAGLLDQEKKLRAEFDREKDRLCRESNAELQALEQRLRADEQLISESNCLRPITVDCVENCMHNIDILSHRIKSSNQATDLLDSGKMVIGQTFPTEIADVERRQADEIRRLEAENRNLLKREERQRREILQNCEDDKDLLYRKICRLTAELDHERKLNEEMFGPFSLANAARRKPLLTNGKQTKQSLVELNGNNFDPKSNEFSDARTSQVVGEDQLSESRPSQHQSTEIKQEENHDNHQQFCGASEETSVAIIKPTKITPVPLQYDAERVEALEKQLRQTVEQLSMTTAMLTSLNNGQDVRDRRDVAVVRDRNVVDIRHYQEMCTRLAELEALNRRLSTALQTKMEESERMAISAQKSYDDRVRHLLSRIEQLQRLLSSMKFVIDEQIGQINHQSRELRRNDNLIRDLYIENADLVSSLELAERREMLSSSTIRRLTDKCAALSYVLRGSVKLMSS